MPQTTPAADRLRAAAPGQRWTVRVRLPDGSATDRLGWVEDVGAEAITLAGPFDPAAGPGAVPPTWTVPYPTVLLARRVPAAPGGPDPRRVPAEELERIAAPAWAAGTSPLGGWTLRSAGGFTGRANSCLAVGDPGRSTAEAAEVILAHAARHGIAPLAQVVTGSAPDTDLRALGWRETYVATDVLVVRLADLLAGREADPAVAVADVLTPAWRAAFDQSRPSAADPAWVTAVLEGRPPRAFASRTEDDVVVSVARGHLGGAWLGLAAIWTSPTYRRRGLATALMVALGHWAARRGARYGYLQVASANRDAQAAYARLGFTRHHRYHYLAPPD